MHNPPTHRWQRWFIAAVAELQWSAAGLVIQAKGKIPLAELLGCKEVLECLVEFIHRAPAEELRIARRNILIDEHAHTDLSIPAWRGKVLEAASAHLFRNMIDSMVAREFSAVVRAAECAVCVPVITPTQRTGWAETVIAVASHVGRLERNAGYDPRTATDIEAPWPLATGGDAAFAASGVMHGIAHAVAESGLHAGELENVLAASFRHAWWPSWRLLSWAWMVPATTQRILHAMQRSPHEWPAGAEIHLTAIRDRHTFRILEEGQTWTP